MNYITIILLLMWPILFWAYWVEHREPSPNKAVMWEIYAAFVILLVLNIMWFGFLAPLK